MTWLTIRQYRIHIVAMLVIAVLLALGLVFAADHAARVRAELRIDSCVPLPNSNLNCAELNVEWIQRVGPFNYLFYALYVLPALVASYVGGPLFAVEFERATHRLAWTQSISRVRWAAVKFGVIFVVVLLTGLALAPFGGGHRVLMQSGFAGGDVPSPFDTFEIEGPALVAYIVFGLAAGALFGAWSRRILTGMFVALLVFGVVRVGVHNLRPMYQPPATAPFPGSVLFQPSTVVPPDAWLLGVTAIDLEGRPVAQERITALSREYFSSPRQVGPNVNDNTFFLEHGVIRQYAFQPADRFWTFQAIEAAIFTALAALCAALTLWRIRTRDA